MADGEGKAATEGGGMCGGSSCKLQSLARFRLRLLWAGLRVHKSKTPGGGPGVKRELAADRSAGERGVRDRRAGAEAGTTAGAGVTRRTGIGSGFAGNADGSGRPSRSAPLIASVSASCLAPKVTKVTKVIPAFPRGARIELDFSRGAIISSWRAEWTNRVCVALPLLCHLRSALD